MTTSNACKLCTRCGEEKALSEFYPFRDGYNAWCKACHRAYQGRKRKGILSRQGSRSEASVQPYHVQMKVDSAIYGEFRQYILRNYGRDVGILEVGSEIFSRAIRDFLREPKKHMHFDDEHGGMDERDCGL